MTRNFRRLAVIAAIVALTTTAEAAKGVKKVAASARNYTGAVQNVRLQNGAGTLQLRVAHHHKKHAAATMQQFTVTPATTLNGVHAGNVAPGTRVRVTAAGHVASNVQILTPHYVTGHVVRHRARVYHPHVSKHHLKHLKLKTKHKKR